MELKEKVLNKIQVRLNALSDSTDQDIEDLEPRTKFLRDIKSLVEVTEDMSSFRNAYDLSDNCRHGRAYFKLCEEIIEDIEFYNSN